MGHHKMAYCQLMKDSIQKIISWKKSLDPMQQNYPSIPDLLVLFSKTISLKV